MKYKFYVNRVNTYLTKDIEDPLCNEPCLKLFEANSLDGLLAEIKNWMKSMPARYVEGHENEIKFDTTDLTLDCDIEGPNDELSEEDQKKISNFF